MKEKSLLVDFVKSMSSDFKSLESITSAIDPNDSMGVEFVEFKLKSLNEKLSAYLNGSSVSVEKVEFKPLTLVKETKKAKRSSAKAQEVVITNTSINTSIKDKLNLNLQERKQITSMNAYSKAPVADAMIKYFGWNDKKYNYEILNQSERGVYEYFKEIFKNQKEARWMTSKERREYGLDKAAFIVYNNKIITWKPSNYKTENGQVIDAVKVVEIPTK